jgi:TPR repeat protein
MRSGLGVLILGLMLGLSGFAQTDIEALKSRAVSGDVNAELELAKAYDLGKGVKQDRFEAADWYMKAAQAGNPEAQNAVAVKFRTT